MRRLQIQVDEESYLRLRRMAFERRQSLAATVRELVRQQAAQKIGRKRKLSDFKFIASFRSQKPNRTSVEHDRALGEGRW